MSKRAFPQGYGGSPVGLYKRHRKGTKNTGMIRRLRQQPTVIVQDQPMVMARTLNYRTGGFQGLEKKFLDCAWNGVAINVSTDGSGGELQPSTGCTSCISCPAQGVGESQRDGRKFTMTSLYFSGIVDTTAAVDQADAVDFAGYFFALVWDSQVNGAATDSENVYVNPSDSGGAMLPQPLRNLQFTKRYKVLASSYVEPGGAYSSTDGTNTSSLVNQTRPCVTLSWRGQIVVETTGTTANVSAVADNALHILAFTANTVLTPLFTGKSRLRFVG